MYFLPSSRTYRALSPFKQVLFFTVTCTDNAA